MAPIFSSLLALGALASAVTAAAAGYPVQEEKYSNNTLITFRRQGCGDIKCGFVYHDFQPNTCAVTITRSGLNISEAIAAKLTLVKSGLLIRDEAGYSDPYFVAWDEGKAANQDGPLQCGTAAVTEEVTGEELCISAPDNHNYHGFSYYRDDDNSSKRSVAQQCTGSQTPDAVKLGDKYYNLKGIKEEHVIALLTLAVNGVVEVSAELEVYLITN